jgi:zinc transport system substrate-binding protein
MVRLQLAAVGVAALALVAACGDDGAVAGRRKLDVVASFYPVAEAAAEVGGDRVRVTNLTPAGVEPHDLELSPRQVDQLEDADLVLYLGRGFQPAVADVARRRGATAVDLLEAVKVDRGDPHFWLDPQLMSTAVDGVAAALVKTSAGDAARFQANARRYKAALAALDDEFRQGLSACARKEIVTSHAAFLYLARRYGLTQLPVAGLSPEAEPDASRLAELADQIKAKGITTVFYEELVSTRVAETLAREAGVKTAVLSPIEGLSDEEVEAGKNYAAVMRDNLAALRQALGCR